MKHLLRYAQRLALLFVTIIVSYNASASHLMGGNLTYEYLGINGGTGLYEYRVTLYVYRLCDPGSSQLPNSMSLGAYQDNPGNPTGPKQLLSSITLPLISQQFIQPPNANDSCTFLPSVCVEEGVFQNIVSLPSNSTGFYFIADRCCRNNNIANLDNPGGTGQAYYAQVPPPNIVNSAPTFAVAPVPFICAGDTVSVLNQAFDVDGDLLVYHFATPYWGIANNGQPNPNPPANYNWPIPNITYAAGYSVTSPFGAGDYINIDTATGLASYVAPNTGFYVVAVEIEEWRNGVLIGVTRRDIQLIVITCPVNPPPVLGAGSTLTYTIQEGQTLCFNVAFTDPNNDSLFMVRNGDIFNSVLTNPPATLNNVSGLGSISSQFCWTTSCAQGRTTPYQFSTVVDDNGCPAKTTNTVYTINVTPAVKPTIINGPDTICANLVNGIAYNVSTTSGYTYNWSATNGSQGSGGTTGAIGVNFSGSGNATVSVVAVNPFGCPADTLTKPVFIRALPSAVAGADINFCSGGSAVIGGPNTPGVTYAWSPTTGLSSSTVSNPTVTLTNGTGTPQSTTYILTTTLDGCSNKDTIVVTANPFPVANAGSNVSICSGTSAPLGSLPTTGYTYTWSPSTGLNNGSISNPVISLTNGNSLPDTLQYVVILSNTFGCGDSDTVQVIVRPVPTANAGNDITFCSGGTGNIGTSATTNYGYTWSPSGGLGSTTTSATSVTLTTSLSVNDTVPFIVTTSLFGCLDRDTVNVIVRPLPLSNAGTNQLLCSGNSVNLGTTNTSGYTYNWTPGTGLNNTTLSNPTLNLTISGGAIDPDTLFYVVVTTLNGCTSTDTVQVILSPVPTAAAGNDVTFCSGQTVNIGTPLVSGYGYTWSPSTGLSSTTIAQPNLTLTNSGTTTITSNYIMTVNWFGCIDRDTIIATIKPLPVSEAGTNTSLCDGDTFLLGAPLTSGYTYSWSPGTGLNNTNTSSPTLIANNPGPGVITQTYLVNTSWNGCNSSDSVTITINPLPIVIASVTNNPICAGASTTLQGSGANTYNWALLSSPGTSIGTGANLIVSPSNSTSYIVTGASSTTCINRDTITITVNQLPIVAIASANDTICAGDSVQLSGTGANSYTWTVQGGSTIGSGTPIYVSPAANTTYILNGTDANNCSNADTISLTVNPAATLSSISGVISICPGVTNVPYTVNNPNPNSSYNWVVTNGTLQSGQGTANVTINWDTAGIGTITVTEMTDLGCESNPVVLTVSINIILTPAAPTGPTTLCANVAQGQIYSNLNTPGSTYNWFAQGGIVVSGNGTGTVTVDWNTAGPAIVALWYEETSTTIDTVCFGISDTIYVSISPVPQTSAISGDNSICVSDTGSFSVVATAGSTYQWSIIGGTILSGNGTNASTGIWSGSGTATVTIIETNSFGCIGDPVNLSVTVNALPAADAGSDDDICIGNTANLSASGGISYAWTPVSTLDNSSIANPIATPTVTTTYTVLVTDANGCKNTDNVTIFVNPLPLANAGFDVAICIGSSTTLSASGGTIYSWSPGTNLSNTNTSNPTADPQATITYSVIVTDTNGCSATDDVIVSVNPLPTADAGIDTLLCNGSSIALLGTGGISYQWSPATDLNNPNIANPIASPSSMITYTVMVTDVNGCTDDDQVTIDINAQPKSTFELDSTLTKVDCNGVNIQTINLSTDALNYNWNMGDGTTTTVDNPSHQYPFGSNATITLIAINNGCSDTSNLQLNLGDLSDYLKGIPNTFTPNGDAINDCFDLSKTDFADCSTWTVFNRWGEKVFQSDHQNRCWNGKKNCNGEPCPTGTYFYVLKVNGASLNGSIMLIR
ncbi:MAG: gliding motility-associated C-terminal domain-containing protein [Bacteroidetes bacterium]|nr:gliding motility-associated C-terminal domain-containing protein [Bacteroidota bacterium]